MPYVPILAFSSGLVDLVVARAPPLEKQPESGATEQSQEPQDASLTPSQALPSQDQPATDMVSEGEGLES